MLRFITSRKSLSKLLFALILGVPGLVHAQSKPAQTKSGHPKPVQPKPAEAKPDQPATPTPNATPKNSIALCFLNMEINALQTIRQFQFDNDQLAKLIKVAFGPLNKGGTTGVNRTRSVGIASKEVREKLFAIRKAVLDGQNEDIVAKMTEDLEALLEKEKVSIDFEIDVTDHARTEAVSVYRSLRADQLASYMGQIADGIENPVDQMMSALEQVSSLSDDDWKEQRNEIVKEIAQGAAGVDAAKAKNLSSELLPLLTKARALKKADLQKQMPELEQAAKKIIGEIDAETVLRNRVQVDLATLLSNGQFINACRGMMKANDAKAASDK
jgi:hypothetical protein